MRPLTPSALSAGLIRAAECALIARAHAELVRGKVAEYQRAILAAGDYYTDPEITGEPAERITDPARDWLMPCARFDEYMAAMTQAQRVAGLHASRPDWCPALEAESLQRDAENVFLRLLATETQMPELAKLDEGPAPLRAQALDIGFRLIAPRLRTASDTLTAFMAPA